MKRQWINLLITLFFGLTMTSAVLARLSGPLPADPSAVEALQQTQVQQVYDDLVAYTVSDDPLDIQLSSFATIYPANFSSVLWVDVVSMPGGLMLAVHRHEDASAGTASYQPSWETLTESWINSPGGQAYGSYTVQQVLDGTVGEPYVPDLSNAQSVTVFAVTVSMGGQSRTYSAAFVWYSDGLEGLDFVVGDNIVAGAADVAAEELPPAGSGESTTGSPNGGGAGDVDGEGCTPYTTVVGPYPHSDEDSSDHFSGEHSASVTLSATCTCDTSCMGTCAAKVEDTECKDSGVTWWCHKMQSDSSASTDSKYGGGASCAAGFSCSETHTWFCLGTKKIKVTIKGTGVEFEDDGSADWSVTWPMTATCGPCVEDD